MQKLIPKSKINNLIKNLSKVYKTFVPVNDNNIFRFQEFNDQEISLNEYSNTRIPPKEILFPQKEVLFYYKQEHENGGIKIEEPQKDPRKNLIFGIRSCDARSFKIIDTFFSSYHYDDVYYFNRRKNTINVGLACNSPHFTCFCTSVGGSPFSKENLDGLLVELSNDYLYESITDEGAKLIELMGDFKEPTKKHLEEMKSLEKNSTESMDHLLDLSDIQKILEQNFEDEEYSTLSMQCLGCGACSYNCPTCHCFDVLDERDKNGGRRIRFWDTCQFPLFTQHGSGHNPRIKPKERIRQRINHKFNYYIKNYNLIGCVGCGRCIRLCPASHDIRNTLNHFIELEN